jgi:regulator of cell morphogenesis and NO signaling
MGGAGRKGAKSLKIVTLEYTVGDIVTDYPAAGDFFMDHKIDFYCGGAKRFREAVGDSPYDMASLLDELNALYSRFPQTDA